MTQLGSSVRIAAIEMTFARIHELAPETTGAIKIPQRGHLLHGLNELILIKARLLPPMQ